MTMRSDYGRAGGTSGSLPEGALEVLSHAGAVLASDYGRGHRRHAGSIAT